MVSDTDKNVYVGADADGPPGSYTNGAPGIDGDVGGFNQLMSQLAEHFDPFIQRALISQPRFWYNMIPRGAFPNFEGYAKETRIFRGGLEHYAGLQDWNAIDPEPTDSNNPCETGAYTTPDYAWEHLSWDGYKRYWGSDPICSESLRFVDRAMEQLSWILQVGADYGVSLQEVWNRDWLLRTSSVDADRSYLMTSSFVGNSSAERFFYDPLIKAADVDDVDAKASLTAGRPFIVFEAGVEIEPLNFDVLDALHQSLDIRCPGCAVGKDSGRNLFGLPVSMYDFERYIKGNNYELLNWRESRSEKLITGLDQGIKSHRGYSMMFDENQLRFKILKVVEVYASEDFGDLGSDLDGKTVVVAEHVAPRVLGRTGESSKKVPEDNPDYITAELAVMPILMRDVFKNLMGTKLNSLGSETYFGPQAGLNGNWSWVNIRDRLYNIEGQIGNFLGKFEIFPKPSPNVFHSTSFLYRRCAESIRSLCPIDNEDVNPDYDASPTIAESYVVTSSDATTDIMVVTATLAKRTAGLSVGSTISTVFTNAVDASTLAVTGYCTKSASSPSYQLYINGGIDILAADPGAGLTGYWINSGVLTYRNDAANEIMAITSVTLT